MFLIQPKLFDYSDLVDNKNSKTLELTVVNSGGRAEKEIKVELSPLFKYTILAANHAGLHVDHLGSLRIDRLVPKQEVTVVLTAEGGEFRKEHVVGVSSADARGQIKGSLQEAQFTPAQNAGIAALFFLGFPVIGYVLGTFLVAPIWKEISTSVVNSSESRQVAFAVIDEQHQVVGVPQSIAARLKAATEIARVTRNGDLVEIEVTVTNNTEKRFSVSVSASSAVAERRGEHRGAVNYIESGVYVAPGASKTIGVEDFLPSNASPLSVIVETTVHQNQGYVETTRELGLTQAKQ